MNRPSIRLILALLTGPLMLAAETGVPPAAESPSALRKKADGLAGADKKSPQPWLLRGRSFVAEKRWGKALRSFAKALKRDPHSGEAYYWRGRSFEEMGKLDEAANEYQAALKASPDDALAQSAWTKLSERLAAADTKR